jgi:hypothetical protein
VKILSFVELKLKNAFQYSRATQPHFEAGYSLPTSSFSEYQLGGISSRSEAPNSHLQQLLIYDSVTCASRTAWLACATAGRAFPTEPHLLIRKREWGILRLRACGACA